MEKVRIVVCDSNQSEREFYMSACRNFGKKHDIDVEMKAYDRGRSLLFDLEDPDFMHTIDILQLEIDIPELSGIRTAVEARKLGYKGLILFLTHSADYEYYESAFDIRAINYIRKGEKHMERLEHVFLDAVDEVQRRRREYIVLRCAGERRRVDIAEIRYFESIKHKIAAYYGNECFEFISTMDKLESELFGRGFVRIHRSFLISLDHVQSYTHNAVTLFSGTTLPIGRTYSASFKKTIES